MLCSRILILRTVFGYAFGYMLVYMLVFLGLYDTFVVEKWNEYLLGFFIFFLYYLLCESIWGKTLGKLITRTKVLKRDGEKAGIKTIAKRSIIRIIPFEALSFLGGKYPIGWHDRWSGTIVIDEKKLAEQ